MLIRSGDIRDKKS